jgi:hypothetical protein
MVKTGGLMVSDKAAVAVLEALSVTFTLKLLDPATPGEPVMFPAAESPNPAGKVPLAIVHEYGGVPPEAPSVCEYAAPIVPAGKDDVVMVKAGALIVSDKAAVAVLEPLSVTFTLKLLDPAAPGEPVMFPAAERPNPAGSVPLAIVHV